MFSVDPFPVLPGRRARESCMTSTRPDPPPVPSDVKLFIDDDAGYLRWLVNHPSGYVLNSNRRPTPSYLKLHRSTCSHLNRPTVRNWTNNYRKMCSDNAAYLSHGPAELGPIPTCAHIAARDCPNVREGARPDGAPDRGHAATRSRHSS